MVEKPEGTYIKEVKVIDGTSYVLEGELLVDDRDRIDEDLRLSVIEDGKTIRVYNRKNEIIGCRQFDLIGNILKKVYLHFSSTTGTEFKVPGHKYISPFTGKSDGDWSEEFLYACPDNTLQWRSELIK